MIQESKTDRALLTKSELEWLLGNTHVSKGYERRIRFSIRNKIQTLREFELPLLIDKGFITNNLTITAGCNGVTTDCLLFIASSKLRCLVENDIPYHKFYESLSIQENKQLYNKFLKWIVTELSKQDCEIIERCMWYSQLIQLELNHIYKLWYGEPSLVLRDGLNEYLEKNEKKYYDRINSFHLKTTLQK